MLTLKAGALTAEIAPEIGGSLANFRHGAVPLMRETSAESLAKGQANLTASYPMIPYCNRITRGRFSFDGRDHQLAIRGVDALNAIHGLAYAHPWQVTAQDEASAEIVLNHEATGEGTADWPYPFEARQLFALSPDALSITITVSNTGNQPMPAGFGLHPYFPRREGALLRFKADHVWHMRPDLIPVQRASVPAEWDFSHSAPLGASVIDHCFGGWDGEAAVIFPNERLGVTISANPSLFGHFVVFDPVGRDFFAAEPMTHRNNALNAPADEADHGVIRLAPGQSVSGTVRFGVLSV